MHSFDPSNYPKILVQTGTYNSKILHQVINRKNIKAFVGTEKTSRKKGIAPVQVLMTLYPKSHIIKAYGMELTFMNVL